MFNDMKSEINTLKTSLHQQQNAPPPYYPPASYQRTPRQSNGGGRTNRIQGRGRRGRANVGRAGRAPFYQYVILLLDPWCL